MIGDFGVPIAILLMVLVDSSIQDTYTQVGGGIPGVSLELPRKGGVTMQSPPQACPLAGSQEALAGS